MWDSAGEELDLEQLVAIVEKAVHRSDPCGHLARGRGPESYEQQVNKIARRIAAGELLLPSLVADAFRPHLEEIDPEDIREITRQIGLGLGFG